MTPIQIEIMLHYHCRTTNYGEDKGNGDAPAVVRAIREFLENGMLELNPGTGKIPFPSPNLRIGERGKAYVMALLCVPLPVCEWRIPETV